MKERENFGSRLGFILVSAGCAIGLGNVWKFPYICGEYGGAAFLVIYLFFLAILGLPILVCEFAVGRKSRRGISMAYDELEPKGTKWHTVKWFKMAGNYLLMMFYTMVSGWMLYYAYLYLTGKISSASQEQITATYSNMLSSPGLMTFWMLITIILALLICSLGLQNGIEKITKVLMCILIVLMIVMAINSFALPNASKGISFYLVPDFSHIAKQGWGTTIFAAMTHAFFTLSIGMGSMEIFGSYLTKEHTLLSESLNVVLVDTFVAIMAGFIIIPACFSYGIQPDAGPSLLFITLPNVFNHMFWGRIWGTAFFLFMTFASISTVIAVFENILSFFMDMGNWSRKKAVIFNAFTISILSLPAVLGYNIWSDFHPLGGSSNIMDLEDFLVSYNLLPIGSLIFVMFCVRKNGWGWDGFLEEANTGKGLKFPTAIRFYMSYILPIIIIVIYLKGYYDTFLNHVLWQRIAWMGFAVLIVVAVLFLCSHRPTTKNQASKK